MKFNVIVLHNTKECWKGCMKLHLSTILRTSKDVVSKKELFNFDTESHKVIFCYHGPQCDWHFSLAGLQSEFMWYCFYFVEMFWTW